jgi:signal peptidase I
LFAAEGWVPFLVSVLGRLYLGLVLSLLFFAVVPAVLGWHATVVQTGSMRPHIDPGDVVVLAPWSPQAPVPVGGVVQYHVPTGAEPDGTARLRLHRIVDAHDDGTFVTAGDANAQVDSTPLHPEQITGQARLLVPYIGLPGLWLGTGNLWALAWWSLGTVVAVVAAVFAGRPVRDPGSPDPGADGGDGGDGPAPTVDGTATPPVLEATVVEPSAGVPARGWRIGAATGLVAVLLAVVLAGAAVFSSAAFTASTASAANTFGAAPDWAPPGVTMMGLGPSVRGTITVTAAASDAETGIRNVTIEYAPVGDDTWTTLCTRTAAPYACSWSTQAVADGPYRLRAVATDHTGLSTTSETVETRVANFLTVVLADPGEIQRGTVSLATTVYNPAGGTPTVRVEYSLAGTNRWSTLCSNLAAPYSCTWNTTGFANDYYDLRSVIGTGASATYSQTLTDILIDNQAPTVTLTDPGTPLSGTRTITAAATDTHSGVDQVHLQYARTGSTAWTTFCTVEDAPYACRFDTTALADGTYSFRAIATDAAGNTTTSTAITNRVIDNTVSSVSVEDPGPYLTGVTPLRATANSTAGITSVRFQSAPAGTTTWTTRCTDTTAPYACDWDTGTVPDGLYDLRAILTDGAGRQTISTTVTGRRVDNSPLRGIDVQTTNGTGATGRLGTGDTLSLTYSQPVDPATITPGWTGTPLPVTVRLRDGVLLGTSATGDTLEIQRPGNTLNLGSVNLKQNYIANRKTATLNATMTATTQTIQGIPRTVVRITLGTTASGANTLRTTTTPATMTWHPTADVTNTTGVPSSTAPVNEPGTLDVDF